jgi:ABC-type cobalamin/Fe3+-siderophores transport system ATPase subunit
VKRPQVNDIKALIRPASSSQYGVIIGENGSGKSTAVLGAIQELKEPKNVVYFHAPELTATFSEQLARSVGYRDVVDIRCFLSNMLRERAPMLQAAEPRQSW